MGHSLPACSYRPQMISSDGKDVAFSVVSVFLTLAGASLQAGMLNSFCSLSPSWMWGQKMFCSCVMVPWGEFMLTDSAGYREAGSYFRFILYLNALSPEAGLCLTCTDVFSLCILLLWQLLPRAGTENQHDGRNWHQKKKKKGPLSKARTTTRHLSNILMLCCFVAKSSPQWERRWESDYLESVCKCLGHAQFGFDVRRLNGVWSCLRQELGREMLSGGFSPTYLGRWS